MRLILVGFGTVGRGVAASLLDAGPELDRRGCRPEVVAIIDPVVGSVHRADGLDLEQLLELADAGRPLAEANGADPAPAMPELLDVAAADVLVEVTPTNLKTGEPGLSHLRQALAAGLHTVTTNKGPVALAHDELRDQAAAAGLEFRFEGTVMSGTPVLNLCEMGLAGAGIRAIRGIVNGTCNFILSEMEEGAGYEEALTSAQEKGYAETDPNGDVEGWDAAAKALILANCVLDAGLELGDVERTGIAGINRSIVDESRRRGRRWRLVASVEPRDGGWSARVAPEELDKDDPLASVVGAGNLLLFDTEALGPVVITGPGAGRRSTGHSVVADLLAIHRARRGGR